MPALQTPPPQSTRSKQVWRTPVDPGRNAPSHGGWSAALLAVWFGTVAGGVVALGGFEEGDPWRNGWVRLSTLAATAVVLAWGLGTDNPWIARRAQLAGTLSLLLHTVLAVGLAAYRLEFSLTEKARTADSTRYQTPERIEVVRQLQQSPDELERGADFEQPVVPEPQRVDAASPSTDRATPTELTQPPPVPHTTGSQSLDPAPLPRSQDTPVVSAPTERIESAAPLAAGLSDFESASVPQPIQQAPAPGPAPVRPRTGPLVGLTPVEPFTPRDRPPLPRWESPSVAGDRPSVTIEIASNAEQATVAAIAAGPLGAPVQAPRWRDGAIAAPQPGAGWASTPQSPTAGLAGVIGLSGPAPAAAQPTFGPSPSEAPRVAPRQGIAAWQAEGASSEASAAELLAGPIAGAASPPPGGSIPNNPGQSPALAPAPAGFARRTFDPGLSSVVAGAGEVPQIASLVPAAGPAAGPTIEPRERRAAPAFRDREERRDGALADGADGAMARTEAAVELGLDFLTRLQHADGRWSFHNPNRVALPENERVQTQADAAATGLVLLAMLGAGYDHFDGPRREPIARALRYLARVQQPSGLLFSEASGDNPWQVVRFYSHGIASLAVSEAYGMTGDAALRPVAQRAIDYIERTQVAGLGGWRYTPGTGGDLSVTGWQLMALRSGQLAGLRVSGQTYGGVRQFVERCREAGGERRLFCYNPLANLNDPATAHGRSPGTVMTSVGLLCQLYLGANRDTQVMQRGADHLLASLPNAAAPSATSTLANPNRDTYYWYYATQVMFHMRGRHWRAWNDTLHPLLVESQLHTGELAGSWSPLTPTPDKWAAFGGRQYVTALNLLSLEVYYRHLPLYEMTAE